MIVSTTLRKLRSLIVEEFSALEENEKISSLLKQKLNASHIEHEIHVTKDRGIMILVPADLKDREFKIQCDNHIETVMNNAEYILLADHESVNEKGIDCWFWWYTASDEASHKERYTVADLPKTVYHSTNRTLLRNVLEQGLIPRTRLEIAGGQTSRKYSPRIYIAVTKNIAVNYADRMEDEIDGYESATFAIDTNKLNQHSQVFADEEYPKEDGKFPSSVYVKFSIPSDALKLVSKDTFKPVWDGPDGDVSKEDVLAVTKILPKSPGHTFTVVCGVLIAVKPDGEWGGYWKGYKWKKL